MTNKAYETLKEMWDNRSENHKTPEDTYVHETEQTIEEATAKFSNYLDSMFD